MRLHDLFGSIAVPEQFDSRKVHKHLRKVLTKLRDDRKQQGGNIKPAPSGRADSTSRKGKPAARPKPR